MLGGEPRVLTQALPPLVQNVLAEDLKASDMEIGLAEGEGVFRVLSDEEVDTHIVAISEQD